MDDGFVEIEVAAKRMNRTVAEIEDLCRRRVLRAVDYGAGMILVEPAIISGAV